MNHYLFKIVEKHVLFSIYQLAQFVKQIVSELMHRNHKFSFCRFLLQQFLFLITCYYILIYSIVNVIFKKNMLKLMSRLDTEKERKYFYARDKINRI